MSKAVSLKSIQNEIMNMLEDYNEAVIDATKEAVEEVANEVNEVIKTHCTFKNSEDYTRKFAIKKEKNRLGEVAIWHVKKPKHRLVHLLEKGHITRNGASRTRAFPHVVFGENYAKKELPKRITEKLK